MKNRLLAVCTFTILSILCVVAKPGTAEETPGVIDAQSAFEKLKGMVGEWKGTVQDKSSGRPYGRRQNGFHQRGSNRK